METTGLESVSWYGFSTVLWLCHMLREDFEHSVSSDASHDKCVVTATLLTSKATYIFGHKDRAMWLTYRFGASAEYYP